MISHKYNSYTTLHFKWLGQVSKLFNRWQLRFRADCKESLFQTKFPISALAKVLKAKTCIRGK